MEFEKMSKDSISLFLSDSTNDYDLAIQAEVQSEAERSGWRVDSFFAEGRIMAQIKQIYSCIWSEPGRRPLAVIVLPVRDNSLDRVARDAARTRIGWVCLNRKMGNLRELRAEFPSVPIALVSPDQLEIGRIQGRQFRALLPQGGNILYIQGSSVTSSAQARLAGMREVVAGSNVEVKDVLDGNWKADDTERTVGGWLRMVMGSKSAKLDLIAAQSDRMAIGAINAVQSAAEYLRRPEIGRIPVAGCDGLPLVGQRLVNEGKLVSTIIVPATGKAAAQMIQRAFGNGEMPPPEIILSPRPYPELAQLSPRSISAA
jgi:ABC-type sugar transport system substrate-binding protein